MVETFNNTQFIELGEIHAAKHVDCQNLFANNDYLTKIDTFILDGNNRLTQAFFGSEYIEEITFEGIIDHIDGIDLGDLHNLDSNSAENIPSRQGPSIRSLFDTLTDDRTKSRSITLSGQAVGRAFETSVGANDGLDSNAFLELVNSRPSWRIVLA